MLRTFTRRELCLAALGASLTPLPAAAKEDVVAADLVIYGATAAGVAAAVQMSRLGKRAVIAEFGQHVGGLTSGGLGHTDIGNRGAIGGISREFYRRVREYYVATFGADYPQARECNEGFYFEPHVAERVFRRMLAEARVPVYYGQRLQAVKKSGNRIVEIRMENSRVYRGRMYLDATYEGDLMAQAQVSYTVGREANAVYSETMNGIQFGHPNHNFRVRVDPYLIPGDPTSGLLPGVVAEELGEQGAGDHRIQAYNFRMCLTNVPENRLPFPKPNGYDPGRYELLLRYLRAGVWEVLRLTARMPNGKSDTNNFGGFSTDNIGRNYDYPNGDYHRREAIFWDHVTYQQGLLWFLSHDERVPQNIRDELSQWGLPKDEFPENGGWPHQLYVREARRMVSDTVMTEHHCRGKVKADDSIGLAAYTMDSHNVRRVVRDGQAVNEGNVEVGGFPPYPISYRSIVPKERECANLLVPICLAASHIAYGSIRMEPVFMVLGQSAATAASLALDRRVSLQKLDVRVLQARLRADGQVLDWHGVSGGAKVEAIDPKSLKGIVLDDTDAARKGPWKASGAANRRVGTGYLHDDNNAKGQLSLTYNPDLPEEAEYEVVLISVPNPNRATNTPVSIEVEGKEVGALKVNQRLEEGNGFTSLGRFRLPKGKQTTVTLFNRDTDGYVVADGIQFIRVE